MNDSFAENIVICVDNTFDRRQNYFQNSSQLKEELSLIKEICFKLIQRNHNNAFALMKSSPIHVIQSFVGSFGIIFQHFKELSSHESDYSLIDCLRIGCDELKKSPKKYNKRLICLIRNKITNTDNEIEVFTKNLNKEKFDFSLDLVCFGERIEWNLPKLEFLRSQLNYVDVRVFALNSLDHESMCSELISKKFFTVNTNKNEMNALKAVDPLSSSQLEYMSDSEEMQMKRAIQLSLLDNTKVNKKERKGIESTLKHFNINEKEDKLIDENIAKMNSKAEKAQNISDFKSDENFRRVWTKEMDDSNERKLVVKDSEFGSFDRLSIDSLKEKLNSNIDDESKTFIRKLIKQMENECKSNTEQTIANSPEDETIPVLPIITNEDEEMQRAIKLSLEENYKNLMIGDNSKQFMREAFPKKKVQKFRERTKDL